MAIDIRSYFANIPKRQRVLLLGIVGLGILAFYIFVLMQPMWTQHTDLASQHQKYQADLAQRRMIAANKPKLEAEIKELDKQLEARLVKLPQEKEIPTLLTQVNTLGQQAGLEFQLFRPGQPVKKGFYSEIPIEIRVEGTYHTLGSFFDRVSKLERIVNVGDLKITPLAALQQQRGRTISAEFKATTFTFLEKGGSSGAGQK